MKTRFITALLALLVFIPIVWYGSLPLLMGTIALGLVAMSKYL